MQMLRWGKGPQDKVMMSYSHTWKMAIPKTKQIISFQEQGRQRTLETVPAPTPFPFL